jgi:hypothetical protein
MIKNLIATRFGSAAVVAASLVIAGTVASASADSSMINNRHDDQSGYTKDQCKDGGWRTFKNPDGSMKFKNQGQCVAFFATGGNAGQGNHQNAFAHLVNLFLSFLGWFGNLFSSLGLVWRL